MGNSISQLPSAGTITGVELVEVSVLSDDVIIAETTISADGDDNSFNDSGNGFITAGFAVGKRVNVIGFTSSGNNIATGKITTLTAGKMTIGGSDGGTIVDEAAGDSVVITAWESKRTTSQDIGDLGTGGGGGTPGPTLEEEILDDNPTAFWKCDEASGTTLADSSGNGNDLTLTGTYALADKIIVPSLPTTKFIRFGGGYASRADGSDMTIPPVGDYTIECVVHDPNASFAALLTLKDAAGNYQATLALDGGAINSFWEYSSGTNETHSADAAYNPDRKRPYHLALVKDGTANTVTFYRDGVRMGQAIAYSNEPTIGGTASTYLGGNPTDGSSNATLAYVAIYNGVKLTPQRIMARAIAAGLQGGASTIVEGGGGGGGGGGFAFPIDEPPVTPDAMDDEFDDASVDAKWVWRNQGGASVGEAAGWLYIEAPASGSADFRIKEQTVGAGPWKFRAKVLAVAHSLNNFFNVGLVALNSTSGKFIFAGLNVTTILMQRWDNVTTFSANVGNAPAAPTANYVPFYIELENDGTNLIYRISYSGLDNSWIQIGSEALSGHLASGLNKIGIAASSQNSAVLKTFVDWFRKVA